MILTHGANSLPRGSGGMTVNIGGREYPVVQIGNQLWLAENLDFKFDVNGSQIPIGDSGSSTTPSASYYDNNETDYGIDGTFKCGLLYNWYAAKYLDDNKATLLPDGWHVPAFTEIESLKNYLNDSENDGNKLKAKPDSIIQGFPNNQWIGTDNYGFKGLPTGVRSNGVFGYIGIYTIYWSSTSSNQDLAKSMNLSRSYNYLSIATDGKTRGCSIRLVKDA